MEDFIFRNLGLIGTLIFVSAYLPQIRHLLKVKDSAGINVFSWVTWLVGAVLLFVYAVHNRDFIFVALTVLEALALITVIILASKYRKK
ncbi:MAG: PQ-loop repeat-containing protein [bacterium]|nr:PQ-loop repeat-containing protein [bacterium]